MEMAGAYSAVLKQNESILFELEQLKTNTVEQELEDWNTNKHRIASMIEETQNGIRVSL